MGVSLIGVLLFFCSCEVEQEFIVNPNHNREINIWRIPTNKIYKDSKFLKDKISFFKQSTYSLRSTSTIYDFSINEEEVQVIYGNDYKQYTFKIERKNALPNILENYICIVYDNGNVFQFIVTYPFIKTDKGIEYDLKNATMVVIKDENLINTASKFASGCVPELVDSYSNYLCVDIPCTGEGHHLTDDRDCNCGNPDYERCTRAHTDCSWQIVYVWGYHCPSGGGTLDGVTPTENGGNSNSTTNHDEIITVPFENKNDIKDCIELNKNAQDLVFKERMQVLNNAISGNNEKNFAIYNASHYTPPGINPTCGPIVEGTAQHTGPIVFHEYMKAIAHNHLKDSIYNHIGTFTPNDLQQFSDIMVNSEDPNSPIEQNELSTYLVCQEGNYAVKVNNSNKLYNFAFKYANDINFRDKIDKYYLENKMVHGSDKKMQNIGFLKLIKQFDLGIKLYQGDTNFENWEQLELNDSEKDIIKKPC